MSDLQDVTERDALKDLVNSPGWELFERAADAMYGDAACVAQIDRALAAIALGDTLAVQDSVRQIRASANAVRAIVAWPKQRLEQLQPEQKTRFLGRRRVGA